MLKNYFVITLRNLRKFKAYSFINITGLAFGIALCLVMFLFVQDELSYDAYHEKAEDIYRLVVTFKSTETDIPMASTSIPVGPLLRQNFPEVVDALTIRRAYNTLVSASLEKTFYEDRFFYSEPKIFDFFDTHFLGGNSNTALEQPNSVVLTQSAVQKYFGDENPIGKSLKLNQRDEFTVTGVIADVPENSHFQYDFLASYDFAGVDLSNSSAQWFDSSAYTYLLLQRGVDTRAFETKITDFVAKEAEEMFKVMGAQALYGLQPLTDIHLISQLGNEHTGNSDIALSYVFSSIAFFILMIACVNFMNLATARSANRAREVGMRKVLGAQRIQLIRQFLGESVILSIIAFIIALVLAALMLPEFNDLTSKELSLTDIFKYRLAFIVPGAVLLVGLIAGSYPALFLSAFAPADVLKSAVKKNKWSVFVRQGLVVFQFSISILLIIGTVVMRDQLEYLTSKDLGFNAGQLVVIPLQDDEFRSRHRILKDKLLAHENIVSAAASATTPGTNSATGNIYIPEGGTEDDKTVLMFNAVDFDFVDTYEFEILQGRNFSQDMETDRTSALLINEATVERFGWESPIGKHLIRGSREPEEMTVIGVVRDFHHFSADEEIVPFLFRIESESFNLLTVRLGQGDISETIEFIERSWKEFAPGYPFEYTFVDENFAQQYEVHVRIGKTVGYLTALAIFIACLGLFGLASFTAEQRTKEIGIRKVLGASVSGIVLLLFRDFTKWIIAANVIAWPAAYYLMRWWLQEFAYKVELAWQLFALAGLLALVIALITISFQSVKAALTNPVNALKYE